MGVRIVAQQPLRAVRPQMLNDVYSNPSQELRRMETTGQVLRLTHGVYVAAPLDASNYWKPSLEDAAMAWATAMYGDRIPVLMGLGAARIHHAIPRALGVTTIALPQQRRPVDVLNGHVLFMKRDVDQLEAQAHRSELGLYLVTTVEQTLIDLTARPYFGGLPHVALEAAHFLAQRVAIDHTRDLARAQRKRAPLERFLDTL